MQNKIAMLRSDCAEVLASQVERLAPLKNQLVYVTGGTGFVGTWLAEMVSYLNDDHGFGTRLILAARDLDAFRAKAPHLAARADLELVSQDVRYLRELPEGVNYLVHAAATPDNRQHASDPIGSMETITRGTANLLDAAMKLPDLKKILNLSSGQIYGRQRIDEARIPETRPGTLSCDSIMSVYPEAKRYAETLCCAYWSLYKIPVVTARPFAFMGPYQGLDKPWAINNFFRDALKDATIRIIGNGLPERSYLYPSDMAAWLLAILVDGTPGHAYNVGSPTGVTLGDLAEKIKRYAQSSSIIEIRRMNDDRSRFIPDDTQCRKTLGLQVTVGIDEALQRSVRWLKTIA
ncbi:dTDP-glucose 4,6-dehydratase [Geomonas limicola]|uniref:dTDP-glucose 4,6-dehydratase n=2 Tax=Geomonas limicola TaxID=2740186 RepID=A0A6V8NBZ8_9BACT|nr:dTDP-glucose 4,6-dehydratase [Geomonas limicola]